MKYATYSKYKPSPMAWLDQMPTHWQVKGLRHICRFAYGDSLAAENREDGATAVYGSNGQVGMHDTSNTLAPVIVVGRKGSFGKLNYSHEPVFAIDTTYFIDKRHCSENLDWLAYALQPLKLDEASKDSAVPGLAREDAYKHKLPVPPIEEQQTIARFLDAKTAQIDALVAQKRQLIDKLKEKRQALIARTVTSGLPPAAAKAAELEPQPEMKDSGVDWLGQIPKHWTAKAVRYIFRNCDSRRIPLSSEERADLEKLYPYYGASGVIDMVDDYLFDEPLVLVAEDGANLLSRSTPLAFLATGKYWVNNHAHILKPLAGDIRYWVATLETFDFSPLITGAAQPKLTADRLGGIQLPVPPANEQTAIADYLAAKTGGLDALVGQAVEVVDRLTEYRQALITSAVTGKIDVRELA